MTIYEKWSNQSSKLVLRKLWTNDATFQSTTTSPLSLLMISLFIRETVVHLNISTFPFSLGYYLNANFEVLNINLSLTHTVQVPEICNMWEKKKF